MRTKKAPEQKMRDLHQRIYEDAKYGVDRFIADSLHTLPESAMITLAEHRGAVVERIVKQLLRHYTIRVRRPRG